MSSYIASMTHGMSGLILIYVLVLVPLIVGLRRANAPSSTLLSSPLWAVPTLVLSMFVTSLVNHLLLSIGIDGIFIQVACGVLLPVATGYLAGRLLAQRQQPSGTQHRRGAVVNHDQRSPAGRQAGDTSPSITLAGVPLSRQDETKHFKIIGTTGTGKSTAIREILAAALARGDRVIIADPDFGYLNTFYDADRGDVVLNPFAANTAKWNLFSEITNDYDVEQLARSLIPESGGSDSVWTDYARTLFTAVVQQCVAGGLTDDKELERLLTRAPVSELRLLLGGTYAGPFLEEGSDKLFRNVQSITASAVRALKYTIRQQGSPFSVRNWVRSGGARGAGGTGGVLFLPYKAGEIAALRSVISAWMRIAIFEAMNRPEGDQRLWFVIDELDALGEIDGLKDALARLRKFGGRTILGFQSIAQVSTTYGSGTAGTIVENCGNSFILRCSASEHGGTSEFASKLIGQREVTLLTQSSTRRPGSWFAKTTTTSEQVRTEPAIMASEIERLPDLEGFLKRASTPDWHRVQLTHRDYSTHRRAKPSFPTITTPMPSPEPPLSTPPSSPSPKADATAQSARPIRKRGRKPRAAGPASPNGAAPVVPNTIPPGAQ